MVEADSLFLSGQYDSSYALAQKARDEAVRLYGEEDTLVARAIYRMAGCQFNLNNRTEAEGYFIESLEINEAVRGPDHPDVADCLHGLADLAYMSRRISSAESLYTRAAEIRRQLQGDNRIDYARSLNGVANINLIKGDYPQAEDLYRRAMDETESIVGTDDKLYMIILNNLGLVSMWQGKYRQAQECLENAISLTENKYGPYKMILHSLLSNIAIIHLRFERYEKAVQCCQKAIAIVEDSLGVDSRELTVKLHTISIAYRHLGLLREAENAAKRCIELRKKYYPEDKLIVASPASTLARIYLDLGDMAAFKEMYDQLLTTYLEVLNADSYSTNLPRDLQAFSWHFRKYDPLTCLRIARHAFELRRNYLLVNCRAMSEHGALKYSKFMRLAAANYISSYFDMESRDSSIAKDVAEVIIASKGQVSDEIFDRNLSLIEETDPIIAGLRDSLSKTKVRLSSLYVSGRLDNSGSGYGSELDRLQSEKTRLEAELIKSSYLVLRKREAHLVTADRVVSNLPQGSSLIEYMRYQYSRRDPDTSMIHYLVLILKPDHSVPKVLDLGPITKIDSLIVQYQHHMRQCAGGQKSFDMLDQEYRRLASHLYVMLWKPIEGEISDGHLVLIAPDGAINLVSFSGLLTDKGQYLAEKYPIHYLSSGRDAIWLNQSHESGQGMIALGDPDYDAAAAVRLAHDYSYSGVSDVSLRKSPGQYPDILRSARSNCPELNEIVVPRLPATRGEVEQAVRFWKENYSDSVVSLFGNQATEDNLKGLAPGKKAVHIATHGFFSPAVCDEKETVINPGDILENNYGSYEPSPLLQSGLFLAGANLHGEMADSLGIDDGILTAEEVSLMDLTGVDWVVLSACESGLGEIEAGEGVYGLRRAFQMAGARTVISSLWPVSDRGTAEFMASLYETSDEPLFLKIWRYRKYVIEKLRANGYSDHPYRWAAFIATGGWQ
jgi:CHAT domain-containing protein/tetratricopeptide (TPR) repeat protein